MQKLDSVNTQSCLFVWLILCVKETSNNLSSQPLTSDNVPVIVDKFISFVDSNGMTAKSWVNVIDYSISPLSINGLLCFAALTAELAVGLTLITYDINIANISLKQFVQVYTIF